MSAIHIHVQRESKDCDGRYSRGYTVRLGQPDDPEHEPGNEWCACESCRWSPEQAHHDEAWSISQPPWYEEYLDGSARIARLGDQVVYTASWATDEGWVSVECVVCERDVCADQEGTFRDHSAEAAGY